MSRRYPLPSDLSRWRLLKSIIGIPVPGAYHLLRGTLPVPEATEADLVSGSHQTMKRIPQVIAAASDALLMCGGGKLERSARFMCTDVWSTLYSLLTLRDGPSFTIWQHPKEEAIALMSDDDQIGRSIRRFYHTIHHYYNQEHTVEGALEVINQGVIFLTHARIWYQERER